jgi:hypothetical protein
MARYERPQRKNPHRLTVRQHVFPYRSIARFADADGTVCLSDMKRASLRRAKPGDDAFCARRAWSERAEAGFMKEIEDAFQSLADDILAGSVTGIDAEAAVTVGRFYALWYMRARHRDPPVQDVKLHGIVGGSGLSKDQEELLEKRGMTFARADGTMPARHINGIQLQLKVHRYADRIREAAPWGIVHAQEGEFVVPDMPSHTVLPVAPTVCLVSPGPPAPGGLLVRDNVAEINRALAVAARDYLFARSLSNCPF